MTRPIPPDAEFMRTVEVLELLRFKKTKLHSLQDPESDYYDDLFPKARYLGRSRIPLWVKSEIYEWLTASLHQKATAPAETSKLAPSHDAKPHSSQQFATQGQASGESDASSGSDKRDPKFSANEASAQPRGMSIYLAQRNAASALTKAAPAKAKRRKKETQSIDGTLPSSLFRYTKAPRQNRNVAWEDDSGAQIGQPGVELDAGEAVNEPPQVDHVDRPAAAPVFARVNEQRKLASAAAQAALPSSNDSGPQSHTGGSGAGVSRS